MKRRTNAAPRRKYLVAVKFRSGAGVHRKSNKALRAGVQASTRVITIHDSW